MTSTDIQRVFRHLPGLFLILRPDANFTIVGASAAYLEVAAADERIFGRPLFEVFPENPAEQGTSGATILRASLQRVLATRGTDTLQLLRYDVRDPLRNGQFQERYWSVDNSPVLDAHGVIEYIVHRVEDASAKSKRDAIQILESITEGFFTLDRQWRFDYVNREAYRILGRVHGDLPGKGLWEEYPGLEGTPFEQNYRRTMYQRETTSFTAFYPAHQHWYEVTTFPAPEGVSVYFRNVTEQKRTEQERERLAAESERQRRIYETALNSTPDFVYVFDLEHRALYANDALLRTWGVDDVRGKKWMDLGYEQWHADLHDGELDQVIRTRAPIRGEIPFTGTNGRRIYDYIFAPVLGPDGEVVAVAGTTRDITDRKAAEEAIQAQAEQLAESDRAKDHFLATLSHELRNPLAPLRNSIEILRRVAGPDDKAASLHTMMERQVNHLVRLVDDLLEMSRISRGTLSLRKEHMELGAVIRNTVEANATQAREANHELVVELPAEPLWMDGDAVRLAQILDNLLNNAIKYTPHGGHISIHAARQGDRAVVRVRDNGRGISTQAMGGLFQMFSRGDHHSASGPGGLGIGLALSQRLAQMHGGTIEARSAGPGQGSEFTVTLPLAEAPEQQTPSPAAAPDADLGTTRVLVVDDNTDAGESLAQVLTHLGAQVRVASNGHDALQEFPLWRPNVVLLDIGMPGMDGYEVARTLRTRYPEQPVTLVALTGWGQEDDRRRAREAGFDHHLVKPAELAALQRLLAMLQH